MYVPTAFRVADRDRLTAFMRQHSFATVITHCGGETVASHLPVLIDEAKGTLRTHLARANDQWRHLAESAEVLVIFHGPHAYVSPTWYATSPAVPTWNYAVVHAYGTPRLITEPESLRALLQETIATFEGGQAAPWSGELPAEFRDRLMSLIGGVEITVTRLEGKFKLGQNRSAVDLAGVSARLRESTEPSATGLAALMRDEKLGQEDTR